MSFVLIIGATSDIAKALARVYTKNGYNLYLAARQSSSLEDLKKDIELRSNARVELLDFDISAYETHESFYDSLKEKPLGVIVVSGYMVDQKIAQNRFDECKKMIDVNYIGALSILNIVANNFEKERRGFIVGVSSVAGDRGRAANYIYGSTKAAFSAYLSGLRNRLYESGVQVLSVKPGFVDTKMTQGMDLPQNLTAQPSDVADDIFNAQQKGRNVLYTKNIWFFIMLIIKHIPEFIFKKMHI